MATTEQLMEQHGVAWFGFDEANGNVVDKLGNGYTGTVTGTTRVEGWNGEGSAVNFSDGNYISFNNHIIPVEDKTIRFKYKKSSYSGVEIILNNSNASTESGISMYFRNGIFTVQMNRGVVDSPSSVITYDMTSYINKYVYVMYSYDKLNQMSRLYIDDVLVVTSKDLAFPPVTTSRNLRLGSNFDGVVAGRFIGQLDDLQIYNKALSPSDFAQKRLVVKTTDNKNLVLSPTSNRVKEIPNTAEYMMLAQGGIIKEIDSAVDRPPIDFTKTTTEYEIVTKNKSALGKGRMFTIPIGNDFKTAMIEGNY